MKNDRRSPYRKKITRVSTTGVASSLYFNGEQYHINDYFAREREARLHARWLREQGYKVRIVRRIIRTPDGSKSARWVTYYRRRR